MVGTGVPFFKATTNYCVGLKIKDLGGGLLPHEITFSNSGLAAWNISQLNKYIIYIYTVNNR